MWLNQFNWDSTNFIMIEESKYSNGSRNGVNWKGQYKNTVECSVGGCGQWYCWSDNKNTTPVYAHGYHEYLHRKDTTQYLYGLHCTPPFSYSSATSVMAIFFTHTIVPQPTTYQQPAKANPTSINYRPYVSCFVNDQLFASACLVLDSYR